MFIVNYNFAKPTIIGFCCCGFIVDCDHISVYFHEIEIMTCSKLTMPVSVTLSTVLEKLVSSLVKIDLIELVTDTNAAPKFCYRPS